MSRCETSTGLPKRIPAASGTATDRCGNETVAIPISSTRSDVSLLSAEDLYLFNEGRHCRAYNNLGAHLTDAGNERGTCFRLWAPNAREVSAIGSFNRWVEGAHPSKPRGNSGIWEGFVSSAKKGYLYKFRIGSQSARCPGPISSCPWKTSTSYVNGRTRASVPCEFVIV